MTYNVLSGMLSLAQSIFQRPNKLQKKRRNIAVEAVLLASRWCNELLYQYHLHLPVDIGFVVVRFVIFIDRQSENMRVLNTGMRIDAVPSGPYRSI